MMKLLMGTHAEVREFLAHYLDGELPVLKQMQFRLHLLMCKDCGEYLHRYDSAVKLARNYLADPPPDELVNLTLRFLEQRTPAADADVEPEGEAKPSPCA